MTDDDVAGIVVIACSVLIVGSFAFYWRQRLRFTRGDDPVVPCSVRWWNGPLGLGWRQGFAKLGTDQLSWRRRLTFRSTPSIVLRHSAITLAGRSRPDWQSWLWIYSFDVISLNTPDRRLNLGLQPDDADVLLAWLGTHAERPSARIHRGFSIALGVLWLAVVILYWGWHLGVPWAIPAILGAFAISGLAGGVVVGLVGRRRLLAAALRDEFVTSATEVFLFLHDFGFDDAFVQHFPWQTTLFFTGSNERIVTLTNDSRAHTLDLMLGHQADENLERLRDLVAAAGHPDPDRITRYDGSDGPLRAGLNANAHALRLWGRSFLTEESAAKS